MCDRVNVRHGRTRPAVRNRRYSVNVRVTRARGTAELRMNVTDSTRAGSSNSSSGSTREELVVDRRIRALGDELRRVCIAVRSWQVDAAAETFLEPQHGAGDRIDPDATARAPERVNPTALAVPADPRRFGGLWLVVDALRAAGSDARRGRRKRTLSRLEASRTASGSSVNDRGSRHAS